MPPLVTADLNLILTTYNPPEALRPVLPGVAPQPFGGGFFGG